MSTGPLEAPRLDFGDPTPAKLERLLRIQAAYTRATALLRRRRYEGVAGLDFLRHAHRCALLRFLLIAARRDCGMLSRRLRPVRRSDIGHHHAATEAMREFAYSQTQRAIGGAS